MTMVDEVMRLRAQHLSLVPQDQAVVRRQQDPLRGGRRRHAARRRAGRRRRQGLRAQRRPPLPRRRHQRRGDRRLQPRQVPRAPQGLGRVTMGNEARKESLRYLFDRVVQPLGFKFSPDEELVDELLEAEAKTEQDLGAPFCPCQGRTGVRAEDMQICCPCIPFHRAALRRDEALLVRSVRPPGRHRPGQPAPVPAGRGLTMWHEVAKLDDIAPGGMKYVRAGEDDREICLCEYDGAIYAVSRRCGHENAPLERGRARGLDPHLPAAQRPVRHPQRQEPQLAHRPRHGPGGGHPRAGQALVQAEKRLRMEDQGARPAHLRRARAGRRHRSRRVTDATTRPRGAVAAP